MSERDRPELRVFRGDGQPATVTADEMCRAVKEAVYQYADRVPLALAIGVLEIAKAEIMEEAR